MMLKFGLMYVFLAFVFVRATENSLNINYAPRNICEKIDQEWRDGNPKGLATEKNLATIKTKCENAGCVLLKKNALNPCPVTKKDYECVSKTDAYPILKKRNKFRDVMRIAQYAIIPGVCKLPLTIGTSLAVFFTDLNLRKNAGMYVLAIACIYEGSVALTGYAFDEITGFDEKEWKKLGQELDKLCNKEHQLKWMIDHDVYGESSQEPPKRFAECYSSDVQHIHTGYAQKLGFVALPMLVEAIQTWFKNDFNYGTAEDDKRQNKSFRLQLEEGRKLFKCKEFTKEKLCYGGFSLLNCVLPSALPTDVALPLLFGSVLQATPITQGWYVLVLTLVNILAAVVYTDVSDWMEPESFAYAWKFFISTILLRLGFVLFGSKKTETLLNDN